MSYLLKRCKEQLRVWQRHILARYFCFVRSSPRSIQYPVQVPRKLHTAAQDGCYQSRAAGLESTHRFLKYLQARVLQCSSILAKSSRRRCARPSDRNRQSDSLDETFPTNGPLGGTPEFTCRHTPPALEKAIALVLPTSQPPVCSNPLLLISSLHEPHRWEVERLPGV